MSAFIHLLTHNVANMGLYNSLVCPCQVRSDVIWVGKLHQCVCASLCSPCLFLFQEIVERWTIISSGLGHNQLINQTVSHGLSWLKHMLKISVHVTLLILLSLQQYLSILFHPCGLSHNTSSFLFLYNLSDFLMSGFFPLYFFWITFHETKLCCLILQRTTIIHATLYYCPYHVFKFKFAHWHWLIDWPQHYY